MVMIADKKKISKAIKKRWPEAVFLCYILVGFILVLNHESWRDEAQAWQIAKQLSLPDMFRQLKYEGHPCLWYLLLFPFAKLGFPFSWMGLISLFLMGAAAWLILKKAPFSAPVKILVVFSSFFVYYFPVVSRSYALIPPLLAWLAVLYPRRGEKPVWYGTALALLTQTHIMMIGLSFLLSFFWLLEVLFGWQRHMQRGDRLKKDAVGLGISLASALFLIWELAGSVERNIVVEIQVPSSLRSNLHRINTAAHWAVNEFLGRWISDSAWKILFFLLVGAVLFLFWCKWKEALIFAGTAASQFLMFTYIYLASTQKIMVLAHEVVFVLWIILEQKERKKVQRYCLQAGLAVLCLISVLAHWKTVTGDLKEPYSCSRGMADYIRSHVPAEIPVIASEDLTAMGAGAYLRERVIWNPITEEAVTFSTWDEKRTQTISYEEMLQRVRVEYPGAEEMYLISGTVYNNIYDIADYIPQMTECLRIDACITDEEAVLYHCSLTSGVSAETP